MLGTLLSGRYQIISQLGQGGFGQTYLAEDMHLPGKPQCVVKQLQPKTTDPVALQTAKRLFDTEAEVLYKLGTHPRIPRLFAHFEENQEFYLVQEFIEGHSLTKEIGSGKQLTEVQVVNLLQDILKVLEFVHEQQVIHRDLKPSNLIRRYKDCEIVLIDFGAVKQISAPLVDSEDDTKGDTNLTIAIGSPGYMPNEQLAGTPQFSSDIYAVGMIGIEALTGLHPKQLQKDPVTGEIIWQDQVQVSPGLIYVLDKMVRYDFRQRYQSATSAIADLKNLSSYASGMVYPTSTTRTSFTQSSTAKWTHQDPTSPTVLINRSQTHKEVGTIKPKVTFSQEVKVKSKPSILNWNQVVNTAKSNWYWGVGLILLLGLATNQIYTYWQLRSLLTKTPSTSNTTQSNQSPQASYPVTQPNQTQGSQIPAAVTPTTPVTPSTITEPSQNPSQTFNPKSEQSNAISVLVFANSTQQFFYSEHKKFASQWEDLSLNKPAKTTHYEYKVLQADPSIAIITATATNPQLKSYTGVVLKTGESAICETNQPSIIPPGRPNVVGKTIQCPPESSSLKLL